MVEESWQQARLIPTSGISGAEEQERRAASAFLAVLPAVKEFGRSLLSSVGAPAGAIETYVEVPFKHGEKTWRPDGLIRVTRGKRAWVGLVEVKTGKNELTVEQVEAYLDVAREQGFDALITISNQIPPSPNQHPTAVDKRKLKKVTLHHWSWSSVVSKAILQKEYRGVSDPDQAWILGELIRYLEHPRSGALEFEDMGPDWVPIREQVSAHTLRASDKGIPGVVARWDALLTFACLQLGRRLGTDVSLQLSRKEQADPTIRASALKASLVENGTLTGTLRIPGTVSDVVVTANLRESKVTCHLDIEAPRTGRASTRVNWLTRQLRDAPDSLRIEAFVQNQRGSTMADLLGKVREQPELLISDPKKEIRSFRIAHTVSMGSKRGRGRGAFIDSVLTAIDDFYEPVVQRLKAWVPSPPRLRSEQSLGADELETSALSSQDEPAAAPEAPARTPA